MLTPGRVMWALRILLAGGALALLVLGFMPGAGLNLALPLLILLLGGISLLLVIYYFPRYRWAAWGFFPGMLLLAMGLILLVNVITGDWNGWAVAWLLLIAALGAGAVLSARSLDLPLLWVQIGSGVALGGLALFALFGAIAWGPFVQLMAAILLSAGAVFLFWLRPEKLLSQGLLRRPGLPPVQSPVSPPAATQASPQTSLLVEPLSARELEVLRWIDQGLTNQEIARKLTVAQSTVKTHINNIYGKLGVETRVQALNRARDLGLLDQNKSG